MTQIKTDLELEPGPEKQLESFSNTMKIAKDNPKPTAKHQEHAVNPCFLLLQSCFKQVFSLGTHPKPVLKDLELFSLRVWMPIGRPLVRDQQRFAQVALEFTSESGGAEDDVGQTNDVKRGGKSRKNDVRWIFGVLTAIKQLQPKNGEHNFFSQMNHGKPGVFTKRRPPILHLHLKLRRSDLFGCVCFVYWGV